MKSLMSAGVHFETASRSLRRPLVRLLDLAPGALLLSGLLLITFAPSVAAANGDWPQFHNGASLDGYNTYETTLSTANVHHLGVAWTGATGDEVISSPTVANGIVYIRSGRNDNGKLLAYSVGCASNGGTCTPLWTADLGNTGGTPDGGIYSAPAVAGGVVYVGGGSLFAFDAAGNIRCTAGSSGNPKTCLPLWTGSMGLQGSHSSPTVVGNTVYIGSNDGILYAFHVGCASNGGTCTPVWTAAAGDQTESSPAVAGGVVYFASNDNYVAKLYAFDAAGSINCTSSGSPNTCTPLWTGTTGLSDSYFDSSPAVANGVVYIGSAEGATNSGSLYAFDAAGSINCTSSGNPNTCSPLWAGATDEGIDSSPAVANGVVYIGSSDGKLYAFDAAGGASHCSGGACSPLWTGATGEGIQSSPAVANGVVYIGSSDGKLYAFDAAGSINCISGGSPNAPNTCSSLWMHDTGSYIDSSPAVANGVVYIGSSDDKLYAFALPLIVSPSLTATPTATPTHTLTPTASPTATPMPTASPTAAPTATPMPTASPTAAPTATPMPTASPTAAPTPTPTPTASPTLVPPVIGGSSEPPAPWDLILGLLLGAALVLAGGAGFLLWKHQMNPGQNGPPPIGPTENQSGEITTDFQTEEIAPPNEPSEPSV